MVCNEFEDLQNFLRNIPTADGKQTSTYAGNSNILGNDEYEDEYDQGDEYYDENDSQHQQNQQHQQHLQHQQQQQYRSFSNGSGSGTGNGVAQGLKHYQRLRRDLPDFNDLELQNRLSCNRSRCALIRCTTKQLDKDSSAWIAFRMRLVTQTLNLVNISIGHIVFK